ncbi:MAG: hypothetical protein DMF00_15960, partial [Verrucomicrobia bacterium]
MEFRLQAASPEGVNAALRTSRKLRRSASISLILFYNATPDPPNLCVMRQDVHAAIAPAKKRAQNPANNADNNRT